MSREQREPPKPALRIAHRPDRICGGEPYDRADITSKMKGTGGRT
jgi:hypothetical protein